MEKGSLTWVAVLIRPAHLYTYLCAFPGGQFKRTYIHTHIACGETDYLYLREVVP
jgi:hypothetical protein